MTQPLSILAWPGFKTRAMQPYTWLLYTNIQQLGHYVDEFSPRRVVSHTYSVWHAHWPELSVTHPHVLRAYVKTRALFLLVDLARARGTRLVWTVHNLQAHEHVHPRLEEWFWRGFIRRLDGYICPSHAAREAAMARFPSLMRLPGFIIPLGHYRGEYADNLSRTEARARLGVPHAAPVILFVGAIRAYKNVPHLIRVFQSIDNPSARLYVAGRPYPTSLAAEIAQAAMDDERVFVRLEHVPPEELQVYLRSADLMIAPFQDILNSSSVLLSLSFDCPILVPRRGAMAELQAEIGKSWVRTYDGALQPSDLIAALEWAISTTRSRHAPLDAFDWSVISEQTVEAYRCIAVPPSNRRSRE